jgi:NTE family protein
VTADDPSPARLAPTGVGLVLGAGGIAGGAFHAGVLAALEEVTAWDPRRASVIVGTSAGSVTGASLRGGLSAADALARAEDRRLSLSGARLLARADTAARARRTRQADGEARRSPSELATLLAQGVRRPLSTRPLAILASLLPDGAVDTGFISAALASFVTDAWPDDPLYICAVRRRDGRLVVFGRDAFPALPVAVAASCAIPGAFRAVVVDGEAYVDGGAHSPTNADLLARAGCGLVLVSSPMSVGSRSIRLRADQPGRRWSRALLDGEALRLRRHGIHVMAFQPTAEDLAAMGTNPMDPACRGRVARQAYVSTRRRLARADTRRRLQPWFG